MFQSSVVANGTSCISIALSEDTEDTLCQTVSRFGDMV